MAHKLEVYDVTVPIKWERRDTAEYELRRWLKWLPRDLLNHAGLNVTQLDGQIVPGDAFSYDDKAVGTATIELAVYATSDRNAKAIALGRISLVLGADDDSDGENPAGWCRGPDTWYEG